MQNDTPLANPYGLDETVKRLRNYLDAIGEGIPRELLDKAVHKAEGDPAYLQQMEEALLRGSTVAYRELFSCFGDYNALSHQDIPRYRHSHGVDHIDSAMLHIKEGDEEQAARDYITLHGKPA